MNILMILSAAAAVTAPALASAAPLRPAVDEAQVVVSYGDLNLTTANGQARLNARIHAAADTVCGGRPDQKDLRAFGQYQSCVKTSIGAATAAIPAPSLVAGVNGHNG